MRKIENGWPVHNSNFAPKETLQHGWWYNIIYTEIQKLGQEDWILKPEQRGRREDAQLVRPCNPRWPIWSPLHLPLCDRGQEENPTNWGFMHSLMLKKPLNQKPWSIQEREENPLIGDPSLPKCPIGTPEWSWRREREENTPIRGPSLSRCPIGTLEYLW